MAGIPKLYIESCPIIDMAKHKAKVPLSACADRSLQSKIQTQRENNVWFCKKILEAARKGDLVVYTSALSSVECTHVEQGQPVPSLDIQDFFNMLLSSGRSGITRVQPTEAIQVLAKNIKWKDGVALSGLDSIHVATALHMGCVEFITTDGKIYKNRDKFGHAKMAIIQASETKFLPDNYRQDDLDGVQPDEQK